MPEASAPSASVHGAAPRAQSHKSSVVQTRIHNRDGRARGRIISALMDSPSEDLCRAGARVRECCRTPLVLVNDAGDVDVALCHCRHRMCPTCSRLRARDAAHRVTALVKSMNSPRFLTLTLKATEAPLSEQIDRLLSCFRQLRRLKAWTDHVCGGVATIECTFNATTGHWHPHLHVIADGTFFPQPKLKAAWLKVTEDSSIVDVRKVNDAVQAARYVASYMCKHGAVGSWPAERIREYAAGMFGRRMLQTFGRSHGVEVDERPKPDRPPEVEPLATTREIERLADAGDHNARLAVHWGFRLGGVWRVIWPHCPSTKMHPAPPEPSEVQAALVAAAREVRRLSEAPPPCPPEPPPPPSPPPRLYDEPVAVEAAQRFR